MIAHYRLVKYCPECGQECGLHTWEDKTGKTLTTYKPDKRCSCGAEYVLVFKDAKEWEERTQCRETPHF